MKYTIYKLDKELGGNRWWRNYDANHRNLPDIDIETYLSNKGYSWVELKNSRNEKICYQTLSKDSYDTIQLYINDFKEIPEYIKIEFEISDSKKESLYYYVDVPPIIYNSRSKLASEVTYTLDKSVPFYVFHKYLTEKNPQMFYVQKHYDRYIEGDNRLYFDFNEQPWYKINENESQDLVISEKKEFTSYELVIQSLASNENRYTLNSEGFMTTLDGTELIKIQALTTEAGAYGKYERYIYDNLFKNKSGLYEYVLTKLTLYDQNNKVKPLSKFMLWPIQLGSFGKGFQTDYWGDNNNLDILESNFPEVFKDDNIIGKFTSYISPTTLINLYNSHKVATVQSSVGADDYLGCLILENKSKKTGAFILVDGYPKAFNITDTKFEGDIKTLLTNINNGNVLKTKENNPHLLAPQNEHLVYANTSNDKSLLDCSYINLKDVDLSENIIKYDTLLSSSWYSRLGTNSWSDTKLLSQSGNELLISDAKQSPIECSAWNNTWLQRQVLDTGRNATIKSNVTSLTLGTVSTILGIILAATGVGAPIGIGAIAGGIGGLVKGGVSLANGLAQNAAQKKALTEQSPSLNAPVDVSGLSIYSSACKNLTFFTEKLSEQDSNIINAKDNMYGYYIKKWLPYSDYLTCWDGNYMLCDMTKNYNSVFNILKNLDSIWTKSDSYINQFIEALNNGITWFYKGNYIDLATDVFNFERDKSTSITLPESVEERIMWDNTYSYKITATTGGEKDLNLSHYDLTVDTNKINCYLVVENDEVYCYVNRTSRDIFNINIKVDYLLYSGTYWTLKSTDTCNWRSKPKGTFNLSLRYRTKVVEVTAFHNDYIDLDTSHYQAANTTSISYSFGVEDKKVFLYAFANQKTTGESPTIKYGNTDKTYLSSSDVFIRVL